MKNRTSGVGVQTMKSFADIQKGPSEQVLSQVEADFIYNEALTKYDASDAEFQSVVATLWHSGYQEMSDELFMRDAEDLFLNEEDDY